MKKNDKKVEIKGIGNPLLITCPACGYSFPKVNPKTGKKVKACPMCGHEFLEFNNPRTNEDDFKKRII